jgi:hypothetical protein
LDPFLPHPPEVDPVNQISFEFLASLFLFGLGSSQRDLKKYLKYTTCLYMGWGKKDKNMALVAWDKLCGPKSHGRVGIQDPHFMGQALARKIWWRWVKIPEALWAKIWKKKYALNMVHLHLIRMEGIRPDSLIWNNGWENRGLIQKEIFWEVHNGRYALFWEVSWEKLSTVEGKEGLYQIKTIVTKLG